MANTIDRTLPNYCKSAEQVASEGWEMVGGDPTHWRNRNTKEEIKGRDYNPKGGKK